MAFLLAFLPCSPAWGLWGFGWISNIFSAADEYKDAEPGTEVEMGGKKVIVPATKDYSEDKEARKKLFEGFSKRERREYGQLCEKFSTDCNSILALGEMMNSDESGGRSPVRMRERALVLARIQDPAAREQLGEILRVDARNRHYARELAGYQMHEFPDRPEGFIDFSKISLGMGAHKDAIWAGRRAIQLDPENSGAHTVVSQAYYGEGEYETASRFAKEALRIDPRNVEAQTVLRLSAGRPNASGAAGPPVSGGGTVSLGGAAPPPSTAPMPEAVAAPSQALSRFSVPVAVSQWTGAAGTKELVEQSIAYNQAGNHRAALKAANAALQADARNPDAHANKILALLRLKRYYDALRAARRATKLFPDSDIFWTMRSQAEDYTGDFGAAVGSADRAIGLNSKNAAAYFYKGIGLDGLGGRRDEALEAFRRASALNPKYGKYYQAMFGMDDGEMSARLLGKARKKKAKPSASADRRGRRILTVGLAASVGGFMIAMGLWSAFKREWKDNIRRVITGRSPAVQGLPVAAAPGENNGAGTLIAGTYKIVKQIGLGGMGVVYEGFDTALERPVAIKKMREEIRSDPRERERFLKEARTVAKMHHPNIVEIYSINEDGRDAYLIFEYVDGKTVSDVIHRKKKLSFSEAVGVLKGASAALEYAHSRGVIHRDLKPSNIMISQEREVKVMDFGVARFAKDSMSRLSMTNTVVGTPPYMAPEQEQGMVRKSSDIYALGVCFYEMVTGELPFRGVGAGMLMAKINNTYVPAGMAVEGLPEGFDKVLGRALDPDPDKRCPSADNFLRELKGLVAV